MSKGAQLEGSSLEWLMQLKGLEDGGVKRTNRVLAVGAQNVLNDLQGAYKKLQDSKGDSNRYVAQQATARLAAISDLLPSRQAKQLIERQQRDLAAAQAMGGKAGVDLMRITKDGSLTLKENAKPNVQAIENAGMRLKDFWAKENTTFRDRVTALTQVALAEGKSYRSLAAQVRQLLVLEQQQGTESQRSTRVNQKMGVSQRAEVIARTEMQTAFVQGQIANYRELGYEWARWSAAAERTCGYCMSRDGLIFDMEEIEGSIPAHPRCRCTLIPVEKPPGNGDKKPSQLEADDHLDDAYWQRSRKKKLDEWKNDPRNRGIRDPKTEDILNNMLRAYERTPTNQQQYLRPGSDAPKAKWKPSDNTIPDLVAAQKKALAEQQALVKAQRRAADAVKETANGPEVKEWKTAGDTVKKYSSTRAKGSEPGPDTIWTAERQALHNKIIDDFLKSGVAVDNPAFIMSGGGPASGKGFMLKNKGYVDAKGNPKDGYVVIDSDAIKVLLPEYKKMLEAGGAKARAAAGFVHEESSYLAKRIMAEGAKRRFNIVLDGTGDNGIKSLKKKVDKMKEQGYRVEAKYVSADVDVAAKRNWDRFITSGRLPPEFMLRNVHADVSRTLPEAMDTDLFDSVELFDTNKRGDMRLVAHKTKGKKTVIDNKELWDDFTRKGEAPTYTKADNEGLIQQQISRAKQDSTPVKPLSKAQRERYKAGESLEEILGLNKPVKEWERAPESFRRHSNTRAKGAEPGPDTQWTAERAALHDEIVAKFLASGRVSKDPTFVMSGGGPASGKGYMLKKKGYVDDKGRPKDGYVVIDSDEIKGLLPEYKKMQDAGGAKSRAAAGYVHEESSYLAKRIMREAADLKYNVVLDGTGDNGLKSLAKKVNKMKEQGYRVEAKYVSADTDAAARRNWDRFITTGRLPPEFMLRNVHADVSKTLPDAMDADLFDSVELFDTNKRGEMRQVAHKTKGQKTVIDNDQLWKDFTNKADAPRYAKEEGQGLINAQMAKAKAEGRPVKPLTKAQQARYKNGESLESILALPKGPVKVPADAVKPPAPVKPALQETGDMIGRSGRVATDQVKADPERFQYKVNANSKTGEVGSLKGVSRWNEELAGVMSVWRDPATDQLFVINGHNRLALAKRMGVKEIPVLQIKAANAKEARMIGAKQNIASGDGTAIDAAKFMRDSGLQASDLQRMGMNLKAKVARDGAALANLPDHIFTAAVEGRLPLDKAAAIGRSGLEPAQMDAAYKVLKTRQNMPPAQIDELLAAARASQTRTKREQNLFGTDEVATTNMVERAKLAAQVKADLKKQVSVLEKAARNAEQLKAKGNRIDVNKAELKAANARAQLEVFDLQKNRPGSQVNKLLNQAATAVQDASGRGGKAKATKAGKDGVLDALDADIKRMQKEDGGVLRAVADLKAKEQGRKAKPPELELEQGRPDLTADDIPPRFIDPAKAKAGTMGSLRPSQVQVDADRFQYKATTEKSGEVGSLEGVSRYDRNLAGVISVWKDPANGQTYVINGHNRLAAAKRLGADAVEVRYIKASTAEAARGIGAMANIAEGHGTAIDAAKWIRSTGLGGDGVRSMGLAMKKDVAIQGVALSNLSDDLWRAVIDESISIDKAAAIGGAGLDADGMANVAKVLKHRPNASVDTVRELVAAEKASMEMGTTGSLFGEDTAAYQMERAQLTRDMRRDMLKDKALFSALANNRAKAELESAGSSLDVDANRIAAAEQDTILTVYDQLKNSSGPVADALSRGARALEGATSASDRQRIQRQTRDEISQAVQEELGGLVPGQTEMPPEAPGQESLF